MASGPEASRTSVRRSSDSDKLQDPVVIGLLTTWIICLPLWWVIGWFYSASQVDETRLGGAGPDMFDYVDRGQILSITVLLAILSGLILVALGLALRGLAERRRRA